MGLRYLVLQIFKCFCVKQMDKLHLCLSVGQTDRDRQTDILS